MPIEVELPDGNIVEFPEGTSSANMELALAKYREKDLSRRYREAGINPKSSSTAGMGAGERIAAGFGKAFSDTASGLKQAALKTATMPFDALNATTDALGIGGAGARLNHDIGGYLNTQI